MRITQGKSHGPRATKLCLMWNIVLSKQVLPRDQRFHHLRASTKHLLLVLHVSTSNLHDAKKVYPARKWSIKLAFIAFLLTAEDLSSNLVCTRLDLGTQSSIPWSHSFSSASRIHCHLLVLSWATTIKFMTLNVTQ